MKIVYVTPYVIQGGAERYLELLLGGLERESIERVVFLKHGTFVDELRGAVEQSLTQSAEEQVREIDLLQDHLHDDVAAFVYERLRRRPMILPVVVEV